MTNTINGLSFKQLEQLWIDSGGNPAWAPTMAAVGEVEGNNNSGYNPKDTNGYPSVGIWQINGIHSGLPLSQVDSQAMAAWANSIISPQNNAKAAVQIFNSQGIGAWAGDPVASFVIAHGGQPLTESEAMKLAGVSNPNAQGTPTPPPGQISYEGGSSTNSINIPSPKGILKEINSIFNPPTGLTNISGDIELLITRAGGVLLGVGLMLVGFYYFGKLDITNAPAVRLSV